MTMTQADCIREATAMLAAETALPELLDRAEEWNGIEELAARIEEIAARLRQKGTGRVST